MTSSEIMMALAAVLVILVILWVFFADWEHDYCDPNDDFLPSCRPCKKDCRQGRDCPYRK